MRTPDVLYNIVRPPRWCNNRAFASDAEGRGFDSRSGHTKHFKMEVVAALLDAQGCMVSITTDWLAGVRIHGSMILTQETPWYNWTIVESGVKHQTNQSIMDIKIPWTSIGQPYSNEPFTRKPTVWTLRTRVCISTPRRLFRTDTFRLLWIFCFGDGMCRPRLACADCPDWSGSIYYPSQSLNGSNEGIPCYHFKWSRGCVLLYSRTVDRVKFPLVNDQMMFTIPWQHDVLII